MRLLANNLQEQLVRAAGQRGLNGTVIRPGYILGDNETGVCNTDDFLIRFLKGCIQVSHGSMTDPYTLC
jgi:L-aminoadipate-semialdehyde dehydrogenase